MKFNAKSRSTATEAQRDRTIVLLRERPRTTVELRAHGIFACAVRIKELRDDFGYEILTELVTAIDEHGYTHARTARYSLVRGPTGAE